MQLLTGLHEAGLASFDQALAFTSPGHSLAASRRHRQIGNGWMLPREYAKALQAFDQAAQIMNGRLSLIRSGKKNG